MTPRRFRYPVFILLFMCILALSGFGTVSTPTSATPAREPESAPNQVLVGFEPGANRAMRDAAVSNAGGRTLRQMDTLGVRLVELPPGASIAASAKAFRAQGGVRYAEPNLVIRASRVPNDPLYGPYLWGLNNTGQNITGTGGTAGADISAQAAWDVTTGSQAVVVGILDSGIDAAHPDLAANLWTAPAGWSLNGCGSGTHGYDAITNDCVPQDENGHGTHVAGTIGAQGNNGVGVTGVNWTVGIMALRFLDSTGSGYLSDEIAAIDYAVRAKQLGVNLRVLNASYGSSTFSQAEYDAINYANNNGILFVAAAGNAGANNDVTPSYPASYDLPNIISVAATGNRDELASFSNYGATSVDLGAPGKSIYSTLPTYAVPLNGNSASTPYGYLSGTSMATPHVSGAAALILAAPGLESLTVAALRARLLSCGDPLAALAGKTVTGKRLNVRQALAGCGSSPPPPTATPVIAPVPPPTATPVQTYTVTTTQIGSGTVSPVGSTSYVAGTQAGYTAAPGAGQVFLGWTLDGQYVGYPASLSFVVNSNRTLVATFAARPTFVDVPTSDADYQAITFLAALGIINPGGVNGSGQFQPERGVARAEVAAFVARTFGWQREGHSNRFPDQCDLRGGNCVDSELWNNVAALADYGVVGGYTDPATCTASGTVAPCYKPRDPVLKVQVVSIVARAFTKTPNLRPTGFWDRLAANMAQYTNVPDSGSQRSDLTTYRQNAGPIPGQAGDGTFPQPFAAASRRFVIEVLWQAYSAVYGVDRVP